MACPTCDHTMHNVGENGGRTVFWCPRCGGLKTRGAVPEFESPTNSHLWPVTNIKAAPELLVACESIRDEFDEWAGPRESECNAASVSRNRKVRAYSNVLAAIGSATSKAVSE